MFVANAIFWLLLLSNTVFVDVYCSLTFGTILPSIAFQNEPILPSITLNASNYLDQGQVYLNVYSSLSERANLPTYSIFNPTSGNIETYQIGVLPVSYNFTQPASFLNVSLLHSGSFQLQFFDSLANQVVLTHSIVVYPRTLPLATITTFDSTYYYLASATIDYVNEAMPELLPNTTLTLTTKLVNDCKPSSAIRKVLNLIALPSNQIPQVILGPTCPSQVPTSSTVAGTSQIPVISIYSTSETLDPVQFPFFMSVQPLSPKKASTTLIEFIRRMGYTKIATVEMDVLPIDPSFYIRASNYGIDVAIKVVIKVGTNSTINDLENIRNTGVRVILTNVQTVTQDPLLAEDKLLYREATNIGMLGNNSRFVWIWQNIPDLSDSDTITMQQYNGTLTPVVPEHFDQPDVRGAIYSSYIEDLWGVPAEWVFGNNSAAVESTSLITYKDGGCHPVNSVFTAVHALHDLIYVQKIEYNGAMLMTALKNVNFDGPCGHIQFDENGEMIFPLGMGNVLFYFEVEGHAHFFFYDVIPYDMYTKVNDIASVPNDTFPLTVDISTLTYDAKTYGQWIPDFFCDGNCGNGACVESNDCQCSSGWKQSTQSTSNSTAPCDTPVSQRDDTIQLLFSSQLFLLTRSCESAIKNSISLMLNLSVTQLETVSFNPWIIGTPQILYEFKLFDSTLLENLILNQQLKTVFNQLVLSTLQSQLSNSSLLAYTDTSQYQIITLPNLSLIDNYKPAIFVLFGILLTLLLIVFGLSLWLHGPLCNSNHTNLVGINYNFNVFMDSLSFIGVGLSLGAMIVLSLQPTDSYCSIQSWIFLISLILNLTVKVSKLIYYDNRFNGFSMKFFGSSENRIRSIVIVSFIFITVILLVLIDTYAGSSKAVVETGTQLVNYRDRERICQRKMDIGYLVEILIFSWYCLVALLGIYLRFLCRFVETTFLDPLFSDLFLFVVLPSVFIPLWFSISMTTIFVSPVFITLLLITWLFCNGFVVTLQYLYQFGLEIYSKFVKNTTNAPDENAHSNEVSSKAPSIIKLYEVPTLSLKCRVAQDALTGLKWLDYDVICYTVRSNLWIGLFHQRPPKAWSGMILSESNLLHFVELDPSKYLLKLVTKQKDSFLLRTKQGTDYASLVKKLSEIFANKVKSTSNSERNLAQN